MKGRNNRHSLTLKRIIAVLLLACMLIGAFAIETFAAGEIEASDFVVAVSALNTLGPDEYYTVDTINEAWEALEFAEDKLALYLAIENTSVEDEAVSASYNTMRAVKGKMFIYHVDEANAAHYTMSDYSKTREHLDLAAILLPGVDRQNTTIGMYSETYSDILNEVIELEDPCKRFIEYIARAEAAQTYAEKNGYLNSAISAKSSIEIEGYPGIEEADAKVTELRRQVVLIEMNAQTYVDAVNAIESAADIRAAVATAEAAYLTVDTTVDSVTDANAKFRLLVRRYDENAEKSNALQNEMNVLMLGLIVGDEPAAQKSGILKWIGYILGDDPS